MDGERGRLIPIGRFAFLTGLSRRALRFYDERGLLEPADVDEWTSYRYYSFDQVGIGNLVRRLREIDLPLEFVREILIDPVRLDNLLDRHEEVLRGRVSDLERALALLQCLRGKEEPVPIQIELREVPVVRAACIKVHTALDRIGPDCVQTYGRLTQLLDSAGIPSAGPCVIGYPEEDFDPESFLAVIGIPVGSDPSLEPGLEMVNFTGGKAAVGTYVGSYDGLHQAWQELMT